MNLPTFAVILEDHVIGRVYGASKVVHLVNAVITDDTQHITTAMSGREIGLIYKALGYEEQSTLAGVSLFDESEMNIIVNQLELLNTSTNSESRMSETLRELVVLFAATLLVLAALGICMGYYTNARQNDAMVESKLFAWIETVIDKLTPLT